MKLLNALSLSMFSSASNGKRYTIQVEPITVLEAVALFKVYGLESCIGHADAARMASELLALPVPMNRVSTVLTMGESAIVLQYMGPRLPEGVTTLPPEAKVEFLQISMQEFM